MCLAGSKGVDGSAAIIGNLVAPTLFGEAQTRIVVEVAPEKLDELAAMAQSANLPLERIGSVTADQRLSLGPIDAPLTELRDSYEGGLPRALAS